MLTDLKNTLVVEMFYFFVIRYGMEREFINYKEDGIMRDI